MKAPGFVDTHHSPEAGRQQRAGRWMDASSPALVAALPSRRVPGGRSSGPARGHGQARRARPTAHGPGPPRRDPPRAARCLLPCPHLRLRCRCPRPPAPLLLVQDAAAARSGRQLAAACGAARPPVLARESRRPPRCWPRCRCRAAGAATCPQAWRGQRRRGSRAGAPAGTGIRQRRRSGDPLV